MFGTSKRDARLQAALAELPDEALAERIAEVQDTDTRAAFAECRALVLEAIARATGNPVPAAAAEAGTELCDGVALDDRQLNAPLLALRVAALLEAAWSDGVHVITASDEQAATEAAWLADVAPLLGFDVALLAAGDDQAQRRQCHQAVIVCGSAGEFACDNLRNRLAETDGIRVQLSQLVAIVHDVTTVMLGTGEGVTTISWSAPVTDDGWLRWADAAAAKLSRGEEEVVFSGGTPILPGDGVRRVLQDVDLTAVYDEAVPLFSMVLAAAEAQDCCREGADYDLDGEVVVPRRELSQEVLAAIAIRHDLPVGSRRRILAQQTWRAYLQGYQVLCGTGVIGRAEARLLRELYDLRARRPGADTGLGAFSKPILRMITDLVECHHVEFLRLYEAMAEADDVVDYWTQVYKTALPDRPDAFAERVASVERVLGKGAMPALIRRIGHTWRLRLWCDHLVRMDTLAHELRQLQEDDKEEFLLARGGLLYEQLAEEYDSTLVDLIMNFEVTDSTLTPS